MQKYQWVLNIPPGQKSITSYKSIKTFHLAPLILLKRFALSQTEELILSHLSLWYGTINTSKYFSFVRHYPSRAMLSPTPALVQCSSLWRNTPVLGATFHPSHRFLQHGTWELHLSLGFISKLLFPKLTSYHELWDTKQSRNSSLLDFHFSFNSGLTCPRPLWLEPDSSLGQIHHPPIQLGQ